MTIGDDNTLPQNKQNVTVIILLTLNNHVAIPKFTLQKNKIQRTS